MGVVTFRRTMSDDATPRDAPAEEGTCMPRSEHAKPSDESALATRVPSPAQTYDTAEEAAIAWDNTTEPLMVRWCKILCGARCIAKCTTIGCVGGCVGGCESCAAAAGLGHLRRLKYAHENGCPWDKRACEAAAEGGHLECLKYLHENGCLWDKSACQAAAEGGHLESLKYLHENGCPWDERACCQAAAEGGHLESLKYLHENGCPLDLAAMKSIHEKGATAEFRWGFGPDSNRRHRECLQYVLAIEQALNNNEMETATTMVDMATRTERLDHEVALPSTGVLRSTRE